MGSFKHNYRRICVISGNKTGGIPALMISLILLSIPCELLAQTYPQYPQPYYGQPQNQYGQPQNQYGQPQNQYGQQPNYQPRSPFRLSKIPVSSRFAAGFGLEQSGEYSRFSIYAEGAIGLRLVKRMNQRYSLLINPEIGYMGIAIDHEYPRIMEEGLPDDEEDNELSYKEHLGTMGLHFGWVFRYIEVRLAANFLAGYGVDLGFTLGARGAFELGALNGCIIIDLGFQWRRNFEVETSFSAFRFGVSLDIIRAIIGFITSGDRFFDEAHI